MFENTKAVAILIAGVTLCIIGAGLYVASSPEGTADEAPLEASVPERPEEPADPEPTQRQEDLVAINLALTTAAVKVNPTCKALGGTVLSGAGGFLLCDRGEEIWPALDACGSGPEGSGRFVVKGGDTEAWDFVVECPAYPECSGPKGALCNASGCTIAPACRP